MSRALREVVAAGADLGTIVPILAALIVVAGVPSRPLFAGFAVGFALVAIVYRAPIPVQPLKAMAALVLAGAAPASLLPLAAAGMSIVLLIVATTPLAALLARTPKALIRGNQLGVGLLLVVSAVRVIAGTGDGGATVEMAVGGGLWLALTALVLPQVPLTLTNAIAGTADLAEKAFPHARPTTRRLAFMTASVNAVVAGIGGMPICHGSSGVTAYRLAGARGWRTPAMLAVAAGTLALLPSEAAVAVLHRAPMPVLAAGLALTGLRHGALIVDRRGSDLLVACAIGAVGALTKNLLFGLVVGVSLLAMRSATQTIVARRRPAVGL